MPSVNCSPFGPKPQIELAAGTPAVGYKLFFYVAASVNTKQNTYTDSTGTVANTNPLVLNALGQPTTEIWFTAGQSYKVVLAPSTDTDPPTSPVWSVDNLRGINDTSVTIDQWVAGPAPTYISATQFSLVGDQTSTFQVGRRIKASVTAGTVYGRITVSAFAAVTTVTVVVDSGNLDSGLSAISYGLLSATNQSISPTAVSMNTAKLLGRTTAGIGGTEEITVGTNLSMSSGVLSNSLIIQNYLTGLTLSTAGASATMSIAAGQAVDGGNAAYMALNSAISKTTSAWAVGTGNGGLDTGAIANSAWYHFWLIQRTDTGVVDVLFSTSATAPTMPASYTLKRRIGAGRTNGSAQWTLFTQNGNDFLWDAATLDVNATNPGTAAVSATLTVPTGVVVNALTNVYYENQLTQGALLISSLAVTDAAASQTAAPLGNNATSNSAFGLDSVQLSTRTNTSAQIRYRTSVSNANTIVRIATVGWIDMRGREG